MKLKKFVEHMYGGAVDKIFYNDRDVFLGFIKQNVSVGKSFVLQVKLICGCSRFTRFEITGKGLQPQGDMLMQVYKLVPETAWPKEEIGHRKPEIPESWATLPLIGVRTAFAHGVYDREVQNRWQSAALGTDNS